jgi:hypothetical protein
LAFATNSAFVMVGFELLPQPAIARETRSIVCAS